MFAAVRDADLDLLFVLLALCALVGAIYCAFRNLIPAALALVVIAVVILVVA